MTLEAGVVIGPNHEAIYWHVPANRSVAFLPDSSKLWAVYWEHRHTMLGYAHSHPGYGVPGPSWEDITTFQACESGLGQRYVWPVTSMDRLVEVRWVGPGKFDYGVTPIFPSEEPPWVDQLRLWSRAPESARRLQLDHDNGNCEPPCSFCGERGAGQEGAASGTTDLERGVP